MASKLNDSLLNEALANFGRLAVAGACRSEEDLRAAMQGGGFRLLQGLSFNVGTDVSKAQQDVIDRCVRLLGPRLGAEKDVENLLWGTLANEMLQGEFSESSFSASFKRDLTSNAEVVRRVIAPNYLFRLEPDVTELAVGPIIVRRGSAIISEVETWNNNSKWRMVPADGEPGLAVVNGLPEIAVTTFCFDVSVQAAQQNADEEAFWLIDVAASLLRLSVPDWQSFAPAIGQIEATAVVPPRGSTGTVKIVETNVQAGGWQLPGFYMVGLAQAAPITDPEFQQRAQQVLNPKAGSIGERAAQALGWLTRGRQSVERAQRLLFFFTAIEALLSSDDKNAPVIQTIARHAGVIWTNDVSDRAKLADAIKKLYAARSALVHAGSRQVSRSEADSIQYFSEGLAFRILKETDLSAPYKDLVADLSAASHGLPWEPQHAATTP
ncbi:hypothetical protein [Brevundimonas sp.]